MNSRFTPAELTAVGESIFGPRTMTDDEVAAKLAEIKASKSQSESEAEALKRLHTEVRNGLFDGMSEA